MRGGLGRLSISCGLKKPSVTSVTVKTIYMELKGSHCSVCIMCEDFKDLPNFFSDVRVP